MNQSQIFAAQLQTKTWVIVPSKDRIDIVFCDPAVTGAGSNGIGDGLQWNVCFGSDHEAFANRRRIDEPQQVRDQLRCGSIAGFSRVKKIGSQYVKDRFVL